MLLFIASIGTISGAAYVSYEWWKQLHDDMQSQTVKWKEMVGHLPVGLGLLCAYISGFYGLFHA